jgi:uncharacterized cupredoxin-like copper-binding protein
MKRLIAVAGVVLLIGTVGCGGDDNDNENSKQTTGATGTTASGKASETLNLSETDFKLNPANPRVSKAGVVEIKVKNDGQVEHSLEVEGPKGEKELEPSLQPGDSGTLTVDLSKPGRYEWYCPIDDHKQMGMEGEIVVAGGGGSSTTSSDESESGGSESSESSGSGGGSGGGGY